MHIFLFVFTKPNDTIAVLGTGYVGLVTGACLAHLGNNVICMDTDTAKISNLKDGKIPFYEPCLEEIVRQSLQVNRLSFTSDIKDTLSRASIVFIAVGTPSDENGQTDLTAFNQAIESIACHIQNYTTIVIKSTVPIGTGDKTRRLLIEQHNIPSTLFDIVANPEFLQQGSAVRTFLFPDRIVIGTDSDRARKKVSLLYSSFLRKKIPIIHTNIVSAETIKYAANSLLALKVGFVNELANLCDMTNAEIKTVTQAMGLDKRIGPYFLNPGPGFGGSCLPKDTMSFLNTAQKYNVSFHIIKGLIKANRAQYQKPIDKLLRLMNNEIEGKSIAILGLSFKMGTDDIRNSPAIPIITKLLERGATVRAHDPLAIESMKKIFPYILYSGNIYDTIEGVDGIILMHEWYNIEHADLEIIKNKVKQPIIVDTRNVLDKTKLQKYGFLYDTMGNGSNYSMNFYSK